jgi:FkbM family methyltransferase
VSPVLLTLPGEAEREALARRFCSEFLAAGGPPKYVFGRNVYGAAIAARVDLAGFVDDFTTDAWFHDRPVVKSTDLPKDALVLVASGGRPLTVRRQLRALGLRNLDYFAFHRHSGLALTDIYFNEGFAAEFAAHQDRYGAILDRLADAESKDVFRRLVSFRVKADLDLLEGFTAREDKQYFEPFLNLKRDGEVFADVGGYDGFTASEFIRLCPNYGAVHVFEPEPDNHAKCQARVGHLPRVTVHRLGLSDARQSFFFDPQGSASRISEQGQVRIDVDRLDDVVNGPVSFIKMDIEGAEATALDGARRTIMAHHPRLAIAAYHGAGPLWRLPGQVFNIRDDYQLRLRHYTESIYETVMFFLPGHSSS